MPYNSRNKRNEKREIPFDLDRDTFEKRELTNEIIVTAAYTLLICGASALPRMIVVTNNANFSMLAFLFLVVPSILFVPIRRLSSTKAIVILHIVITVAALLLSLLFGANTGNMMLIFNMFTTIRSQSAIFGLIGTLFNAADLAVICISVLLCELIFSIYCYFTRKRIRLTGLFLTVSIGLFFLMTYETYVITGVMIDAQMSLILMIIIACYMYNKNTANIDDTINEAMGKTIAPAKSIMEINSKVTSVIICAVMVVFITARFATGGAVTKSLYKGFDKSITYIKWFMTSEEPYNYNEEKEIIEGMEWVFDDGTPPDEPVGSTQPRDLESALLTQELLVDIAIYVVEVLVVVAFMIVVLYGALKKYKEFKELKVAANPKVGEDEKTFVAAESESQKQQRLPPFSFALRDRARRMFYNKVRSYSHKNKVHFRLSDTAGEMSGKIRAYGEHEDVRPLKRLYDKARYSSLEIVKEDFKNLSV